MAIISLTTDFGMSDWFVGSMKGVILAIEPTATIVDLTHEVPAGDIRAGAFALAAGAKCFPRFTIHIVVVDPGVGSERGVIAVRTADYVFVAPDNGVLSFALANEPILDIRSVERDAYFRKPVSNTFHGRDIFAPVAGHLAKGLLLESLGPKIRGYGELVWTEPAEVGGAVRGEIVWIDHFGNAVTNINSLPRGATGVRVPAKVECDIKEFYQQAPPGQPLALIGSTGFLEIALNSGHAAQSFGLKIGDPVVVK